jgi:Fe-S cluster biosynthesis and repair protein YggX
LKEELKELHEQDTSNNFTSVSQFTRDSILQLVLDDKQRQSSTENYVRNEQNETDVQDEFNDIKSECIETNSTDQPQFQNETENVRTDKAEQSKETCHKTDIQNVKDSQENNRIGSSDNTADSSCEISSSFRDVAHESTAVHKAEEKGCGILSNYPKLECSKIQALKPKKNRESKKKLLHIPPPMTNAVIHIEKCLYEWFTIESMCFLFGEKKIKEMVEEKGECIKEYYKVTHNVAWDPKIQKQYMAICRRLNIMEIEDHEYDNQIATKPLPDYTAVREEAKKMDLKVKAYYQGKTVYEDEGNTNISETHSDSAPVLPLVDLHAQNALRRRIVLDHLNRM